MFQLSRDEQVSIAIAFLIISLIVISVFIYKPRNQSKSLEVAMVESNIITPSQSKSSRTFYPAKIYVHITGEVRRPNVYVLWKGTRLFEVLALAGLTPESDADQLNLAALLQDGDKIRVPAKGEKIEENRNTMKPSSRVGMTSLININKASMQELESLRGIGPVYASRIIEYRLVSPFSKKEDIMKVKGIGEKTYEKFKDNIIVE